MSLKEERIILLFCISSICHLLLMAIIAVLEEYFPAFPFFLRNQLIGASCVVGIFYVSLMVKNFEFLAAILHAPIHRYLQNKIKSLETPTNP